MMKRPTLIARQKQILKTRILVVSASLLLTTAVGIYIINVGSSTNSLGAAGFHGTKTVSTSNVILNEYTTLATDVSSASTSITVASSALNSNSRFAANLAAGELVMIIQMQGASVSTSNNSGYGNVSSYNNSGYYEFAEVAGVPNSTTINLTAGLRKSYTSSCNTQVIRVPRYSTFTINSGASVTCPAWNGSTGGIVAIESNGVTNINGTIDVSGKGFRGGTTEQYTQTPGNHSDYRSNNNVDGAEKGESIAGLATSLSHGEFGRGAPANGGGGGNSHNGGGGGGANAGSGTWNGGGLPDTSTTNWKTAWNLEGGNFATNNSSGGGRGGYTWSADFKDPITLGPANAAWVNGDGRYNMGGLGGHTLDYSTGRIFMGGGGGAGDSNNGVATPGGSGGGIAFIISAGKVDGTGTINANGNNVSLSTGSPGDASGGGGGGGTIIIYTSGATVNNLKLNAKGGIGGSQALNNGAEVEGPGGGGGGGYISTTNVFSLTRNVSGGGNGSTDAPAMTAFMHNGATKGAPGLITTLPASPYSGSNTLPVQLVAFGGQQAGDYILLTWATESEKNNDYFTIEKSIDGKNYAALGKVDGAGNSNTTKNYHFLDVNPAKGSNYYRLEQTDFNGAHETFNCIQIMFNGIVQSADIKGIYPNPFIDKISVSFYMPVTGTARFFILNSAGQEVRSMAIQAEEGLTSVDWKNLNVLPSGTYTVVMNNNNNRTSGNKIIKK
ncbi:MAG: T9SS type A sorting domain-containing protein [Bacteroidota bacterium]